jgi:hypothetical protein
MKFVYRPLRIEEKFAKIFPTNNLYLSSFCFNRFMRLYLNINSEVALSLDPLLSNHAIQKYAENFAEERF